MGLVSLILLSWVYYSRSKKSLCSDCVPFLLPFACSLLLQLQCVCVMRFYYVYSVCVFITVAITVRVHYAFTFAAVFFTLSPAAVAENTLLQVVTVFSQYCAGIDWKIKNSAESEILYLKYAKGHI